MSTRATVHFTHAKGAKTTAIIYRHSDGYPSGLGKDLADFLEDIAKNIPDNRFNDPAYLAAKWVVTDAARMTQHSQSRYANPDKPSHPCDFLSVGILAADPGDIEHRYTVVCDDSCGTTKLPQVIHEMV